MTAAAVIGVCLPGVATAEIVDSRESELLHERIRRKRAEQGIDYGKE